jgi:hypothetical protein
LHRKDPAIHLGEGDVEWSHDVLHVKCRRDLSAEVEQDPGA